ncbi:hypothetical protein [Winogradskyella ouciana]|uniref:Uncharacterized protein n=1 Tax=Winogradskyella ouciana TaxID=2608631 RepID=A0A7K1G917_9FLAO|nr:hypothetical protein [Winogradskyella ouciana]MTE25641.1 hypothetical protein [Winogradskyella ouciana]
MDTFTKVLFLFIALGGISGFIYAIKQIFDSEADKKDIIESQKIEIINLKTSLNKSNEKLEEKQIELKDKSDSIEKLANDVLNFSKNINTNTDKISELTNEISEITSKTNQVAEIIEIEQRQKGTVKLKRPNSSEFKCYLASNSVILPSTHLEKGVNMSKIFSNFTLDILVKLSKESVLISTILNDKYGNRIIELKDGNWALNKSNNFSINYDDQALEIIDNKGFVVFQVELILNELTFKGIHYGAEQVYIYNDYGIFIIGYESDDFNREFSERAFQINRLFEHVGANYLGKRSNYSVIRKQNKSEETERIKKSNSAYYKDISNKELIKKTNIFIHKIGDLLKVAREKIVSVMDKKNINYEKSITEVNEEIINYYNNSLRSEGMKLRNTYKKKGLNFDKSYYIARCYENPTNHFPDLKSVKSDLENMVNSLVDKKE